MDIKEQQETMQELFARVKLGNEKLNAAWKTIQERNSWQGEDGEKFKAMRDKLNILCQRLVDAGYKKCLYLDSEGNRLQECLNVSPGNWWCWACPAIDENFLAKLFDSIPSAKHWAFKREIESRLTTKGFVPVRCQRLGNKVICVVKEHNTKGVPACYPQYTVDEFIMMGTEIIQEKDVTMIEAIKGLGAEIVAVEKKKRNMDPSELYNTESKTEPEPEQKSMELG